MQLIWIDLQNGRGLTHLVEYNALYGSKAMPKQVFGEGELLTKFHNTMTEEAPGIWELNTAMLALWQPDALSHDWILPDNFHVQAKVTDTETTKITFLEKVYQVTSSINAPTEHGLSLGANITHSIDGMIVREIGRRCNFKPDRLALLKCLEKNLKSTHQDTKGVGDTANVKMVKKLAKHYQESGFLSARILDHLDDDSIVWAPQDALYELFQTLPKKPFPVLAIHDCFRVHPNYANDLRKQYNQIIYEIAQSNLLENLASQITGQQVKVTKKGNLGKEILEANYALS